MEIKKRIKPNWFITSEKEISKIYCPICGAEMEKILHTPKNKPPMYHCVLCDNYSYHYHFGFSDL